jgi:hypothetical protein
MRVPITKDVDPGTLATQLSTALGIQVAVSARNPGQKDDQGKDLPGVVVLLDANTGNELPDQDAAKVTAVLTAHTIPVPPKTPARTLADALGSAASLADIKAALVGFATKVADQEDQTRQRGPRGRG